MTVASKVCIVIGIGAAVAWQVYALEGAALLSVVPFLPLLGLLLRVARRIQKNRGDAHRFSFGVLAVGIWLIASSTVGVLTGKRPGHEADGMLGVIYFLLPLSVSLIGCLLLLWWWPQQKRSTYHDNMAELKPDQLPRSTEPNQTVQRTSATPPSLT